MAAGAKISKYWPCAPDRRLLETNTNKLRHTSNVPRFKSVRSGFSFHRTNTHTHVYCVTVIAISRSPCCVVGAGNYIGAFTKFTKGELMPLIDLIQVEDCQVARWMTASVGAGPEHMNSRCKHGCRQYSTRLEWFVIMSAVHSCCMLTTIGSQCWPTSVKWTSWTWNFCKPAAWRTWAGLYQNCV